MVITIVHQTKGVSRPTVNTDIIKSHRLGWRQKGVRPRPVIVRFANREVRDVVILARCRIRENNNASLIYVNEDLTQRRAPVARKTRQMKKSRKINDCRTCNCKVIIKTLENLIHEVHANTDLEID